MDGNMKVLLIDDELGRLQQWQRELETLPEMEGVSIKGSTDVQSILETLGERRLSARSSGSCAGEKHALDDTDIVIIDHDLGPLTSSGAEVAYLARCFSSCGVILLLNANGENAFDLHLHPNLDMFADIELGSTQLSNPGLWGSRWSTFRPWGWPATLFDAVERQERRTVTVTESMDQPFLAAVGVEDDDSSLLPRLVVDRLWRGSADQTKELKSLTFRDLAQPGMGVVRRKDVVLEHALPRVLASRVGTWLEGFVLGGQEVLVDAPHLALRFPSLFYTEPGSTELEPTISFDQHDPKLSLSSALNRARFPDNGWLSRPAWRWRRLQTDRDVAEVANPFDVVDPGAVFCEDRSAFLRPTSAKPFKSDLGTPFDRRWIAGRTDVEGPGSDVMYLPADRLLL